MNDNGYLIKKNEKDNDLINTKSKLNIDLDLNNHKKKSLSVSKNINDIIIENKIQLDELKRKINLVASKYKKMNLHLNDQEYIDGIINKMPNSIKEEFYKTMIEVENDVDKLNYIVAFKGKLHSKTSRMAENKKFNRHLVR